MSARSAANAGIGASAPLALPTCGAGLPQTPAEQLTIGGPQRVRAPGRATRSANGSACCQSETTVESSARQTPHARRRRSENRLQFAAGGPGPLTEDRQKTEATLEALHQRSRREPAAGGHRCESPRDVSTLARNA